MNIQQTIEKARWVATEAQVETLAHQHYVCDQQTEGLNGTYLRVLVVGCQAEVGTTKRGRKSTEAQLTVLAKVHDRFYAAVLRGVTTDDVAPDETQDKAEQQRRTLARNSRSNFARTAKATLVGYVKGGGDLRSLDPATVTKAALRAAIAPPEPTDRVERRLTRAQGSIIRAVNLLARGDPDKARNRLEALIGALQGHLAKLPETAQDVGATTTITAGLRDRGPRRTRVGGPVQIHRGAQ